MHLQYICHIINNENIVMDINQIGFIMPIKDVFYITGVGVIATGIVSTGELRTGELVEIIKTNGDTLYSKVNKLRYFDKIITHIQSGDVVAIELKGIVKSQLSPGNIIIKREREFGDFSMKVEGVFDIVNKGIVVIGLVSTGLIKIGDYVEISKPCETSVECKISGIEINYKHAEFAYAEQYVALILSGVKFSQIHKGDVIQTI